MRDLKVIENELVPVYETSAGEKVVYGTELYESLGSKRQYTDWIKGRLVECDAVINEDYQSFSQNNEKPNGGRPKIEYVIKLDTAKEMAMLERNEKGKKVRRYFIAVEKKYKENKGANTTLTYQYPLPATTFEGVANLGRLIERVMRNEGACPHEIAEVLKPIFQQAGIDVQECFVKLPAYEQLVLSGLPY